MEIRFTFCFRFQYVKERRMYDGRCTMYDVRTCLSGNPRAWTSVPGRFPSFLLYIFTETRELQHLRKHFFANLAVPIVTSFVVIFCLERRCSLICLAYGRAASRDTFSRKEVFQPHLPVRLPCYDLAPITSFALGRSSR